MVEIVDGYDTPESHRKDFSDFKIKGWNETIARIVLKLIPLQGEEPQKHNIGYFTKVLSYNSYYIEEILSWLSGKDLVSCDGEYYYLSNDNIWRLQEFIKCQSSVVLAKRLEEMGGA